MSQQSDLEEYRRKLEGMELPEIADHINGIEGFAWKLDHDAADGRIEGSVDADIQSMRSVARMVAEVFAAKAGINIDDMDLMRQRIREELARFEDLLTERWKKIFQPGAVFSIRGGYRCREGITELFEVVGIYDCVYIGSEEAILARERGSLAFSVFDRKYDADLMPVEAEPKYVGNTTFLRATGRGRFPPVRMHRNDIRETGTVFAFQSKDGDPRQGTWETFYDHLCVAGSDGEETVVIARSQSVPAIAEFTAADLSGIYVLNQPRRFIQNLPGGGVSIPLLDLSVG